MAVRISIVTPSLNQAEYLERTILSVANQVGADFEHIIVDGGSTDGSVAVLERHASKLAYWVSEPDRGQSHAINKGIARASGDVIAYINSDDFYLPGALEAAARTMVDPHVRWCVGRCRYENADGSLETLHVPSPPRMPRRTMIREAWYVPQAASFWRADVFTEIGLLREDLHYIFDLEFGLRCALNNISPTCIDDEIAVRFLHDEAKSADLTRFADEWTRVQPELEASSVGRVDVARDVAYRMLRRARRVGMRALQRVLA